MEVDAGAENDLREDEKAEPRHGKEQRIPLDGQFAVEELFAKPETGEESGAGLQDESRPGLDRAKGDRTEHEQSESSVKQDGFNLRRCRQTVEFLPLFSVNTHQGCCFFSGSLRRFSGEMKIVDPELTTDWTAGRKPADVQYDEFAIRPGGEVAFRRLPETGVGQLIALVINRLACTCLES